MHAQYTTFIRKKEKKKYYIYVTVHACIAESDISALSWLVIGPVSNLVYFFELFETTITCQVFNFSSSVLNTQRQVFS